MPVSETQSPAPHPYIGFVHEVLKPARYLGGEYQALKKPGSGTR